MKGDPEILRHHLSLVSKFAFAMNPYIFFPFDKFACTALSVLDERGPGKRCYVRYMTLVTKIHVDYAKQTQPGSALGDELTKYMTEFELPDLELCQRRSLDKTLMLLGGFGRAALGKQIKKARSELMPGGDAAPNLPYGSNPRHAK